MFSYIDFIFKIFNKVEKILRKNLLILVSLINNGKISIKGNLEINNKVRFLGNGELILDDGVKLGYKMASNTDRPIMLQPRYKSSKIVIGNNTVIGNGTEIICCASISIGRRCLFGPRVIIYDSDFHGVHPEKRSSPNVAPVSIGDNVWIGTEAIILKGVNIGKDAVIGARCVVTRDVPQGAIVTGNPMKIVGSVYEKQ
jgi:acetyltransferase-like isoleucine patch superfamily enzyme